ncbi:cytochrome b [Mycolicibacterium sp. CH28]|uniref:cytochrome b n=1 Tax=Mycolicibacterium sp. CH28 TaxID=2512237 RepID=UPI0010813E38|nr:cytochrome b/b6 domain-containing protein [Mycolicibacterium sp. CH28]TGD90301.1 cytochrome b [Mycolicibacterium sp. CH28]
MTGVDRYPVRTRVLHWVTAALVFTTLFVGFVMVSWLDSYAALVGVHMTLGVLILVVVVIRAANRFTHRTPTLPATVGSIEQMLVVGSELGLYALMLAQPLIGWAMVSAGGRPVVLFGSLRLPRIAPFDADLYFVLRQAHSVLAYLLVLAIAAHISAVLLHTLTLRDRMLSRMTFGARHGTSTPPNTAPRHDSNGIMTVD